MYDLWYYEGYLQAKYGPVGRDGKAQSFHEIAKEMLICAQAKSSGYWPIAVRKYLVCSDTTKTKELNGQQVRELAIKHLAEINPQSWEKELTDA